MYDEVTDRHRRWKVQNRPFTAMMEQGFTLQEVCAIYFSRSLLETLAGGPFQKDLQTAFAKTFRQLPKRITCPKCKRTRGKAEFGLRVTKKTDAGLPVTVKPQSWCRECRAKR